MTPRLEREHAEMLLQRALSDPAASFRDGQWEAIDTIVNARRKLLVVQRTGWGKSAVYFIATRALRDAGAGPTLIVSPLLALMRNQIEAAARLGIRAETINSTNKDEWQAVQARVLAGEVDAVLISPERLANEGFIEDVLMPLANRIGLLVVDEAHCISDWGHDFRPDYRRIVNVLRQMPPNMPVLGTTATANNRVVNDVLEQLGDITIQRGPLVRESLALQTLALKDQPARLAWLAQYVPKLPGTGIIYVLTKRDADIVSGWLNHNGIVVSPYYSGVKHADFATDNDYRQHLEEQLLANQLKALVATTALGMGYDKPDLGFVIHYQAPGSIVGYYQQVGRAGRGIDHAYGVLLSGDEDDDIHDYFRRTAFPGERGVEMILETLEQHDGMTLRELEQPLNLSYGQIEKALKFLSVESPAPVIKERSRWLRTPVPYRMDHERIAHLTQQREVEWQEVQDYIHTDQCLMSFLREALDDPDAAPCGRCANCLGQAIIGTDVDPALANQAAGFLRRSEMVFKPKIQVPSEAFAVYGFRGNLPEGLRAAEGRILARWGDAGWGQMVLEDKHQGRFRDELVRAVGEMIRDRWRPDPPPEWVTCVPSLRHPDLVPDFARRLAAVLGIPFVDAVSKVRDNEPQKNQQNRDHQCRNLDGAFEVAAQIPAGPVLLVDDVIDSGWTVTVLAALLRGAGSSIVYPVALATTSSGD